MGSMMYVWSAGMDRLLHREASTTPQMIERSAPALQVIFPYWRKLLVITTVDKLTHRRVSPKTLLLLDFQLAPLLGRRISEKPQNRQLVSGNYPSRQLGE